MLKLRTFKVIKNRRFNYTPRYYEGKDIGNVYDFGSKIEKYRETTNANDLGAHWRRARADHRNRKNGGGSKRLYIIIAILLLLTLAYFDFNLTIFFPN